MGNVIIIILLVLAALIGFCLLVLLWILLARVRYRIEATEGETSISDFLSGFSARGKALWLFPFLFASASFEKGQFSYTVRFLGIRILDSFLNKKFNKQTEKAKRQKEEKKTEPSSVYSETVPLIDFREKQSQQDEKSFSGGNTDSSNEKKEKFFSAFLSKASQISEWTSSGKALLPYIGKVMKVILPKRFTVQVVFGMEDPADTGSLFGSLCALIPFIADGEKRNIVLVPDFEKKTFGAKGCLKGSFCLGSLVVILIKAALDKDLQEVLHNI